MLNVFVCGGIHHEEEDGPCSSPNKKSSSSKRKDNNKNPYSTRGLDKFSELLADLDERRQKVYSQMNPHDISFVRFAYSNTDDFVPIVVKVKKDQINKNKHKSEELKVIRHLKSFSEPMDKSVTAADVDEIGKQQKLDQSDKKNKKKAKKSFSWKNCVKKMNHPSFYVPAVMIMILVLLTVFGRSVTTLCTCVMWYVVPTLSNLSSSSKQQQQQQQPRNNNKITTSRAKNKDYARGLSEKKMAASTDQQLPASPRTGGGDSKASGGKHSHQKSW